MAGALLGVFTADQVFSNSRSFLVATPENNTPIDNALKKYGYSFGDAAGKVLEQSEAMRLPPPEPCYPYTTKETCANAPKKQRCFWRGSDGCKPSPSRTEFKCNRIDNEEDCKAETLVGVQYSTCIWDERREFCNMKFGNR